MHDAIALSAVDRQLADVVGRLLRVLEEENQILLNRKDASLDTLIQKKSQLLLELLRVQKTSDLAMLSLKSREALKSLRSALAANSHSLKMNLSAAREITETILEALRQGESDGTYGSNIASQYGAV